MQRNVLEYLEKACEKHPEKVVFADDKEEITYESFVRQAQFLGTFCQIHGFSSLRQHLSSLTLSA